MDKIVIVGFSTGNAMEHYLGEYRKAIEKEGVNCVLITPSVYKGYRNPLKDIGVWVPQNKYLRSLWFFNPILSAYIIHKIKKNNGNICHILSGESYPCSFFLVLLCNLFGVKSVLTFHDVDPHPDGFLSILHKVSTDFILRYVSLIHMHSAIFKKYIKKKHQGKIVIAPHGSFFPHFAELGNLAIEKDHSTILFFGRIEPYKGVEILLQSLQHTKASFTLVIAGEGKLAVDDKDLAKCENVEVIIYNHYIDDDFAADLFRRAGCLVLPYIQATQSSLPSIANGFGCDIVATKVGVFVDEIKELEGRLIEPNCPIDLGRAIDDYLTVNGSRAIKRHQITFSTVFQILRENCYSNLVSHEKK